MIKKIELTQENIDSGTKSFAPKCPVALAMRDHGLLNPRAFLEHLSWSQAEGERHKQKTPKIVNEFIMAFDYGKKVYPFSFSIDTCSPNSRV